MSTSIASLKGSFRVVHIANLSEKTIKIIRAEYGRGSFTNNNNEEVEDLFHKEETKEFLELLEKDPNERGTDPSVFTDADYKFAVDELALLWHQLEPFDYFSIDSVG